MAGRLHLFNQGNEALRNGNAKLAIELLKKAYEINKNDLHTCVALGLAYNLIGHNEESIRFSKEALNINPNSFVAQFNLAVATNHLKEPAESLREYLKAEEMAINLGIGENITIGKLNLFLGHDYRDLKKYPEARRRYSNATRIFEQYNTEEAKYWLNDAQKELVKLINASDQ